MDATYLLGLAALIPVATGIVQIIKMIPMPKWAVRVVSLFVGVGLAMVIDPSRASIIPGLVVGLAAQGLYETTIKPTIEKIYPEE